MKRFAAIIGCLLAVVLVVTGCSSDGNEPIQVSLSKDGVACIKVIQAYWAAFNNFDLDKAVSYLDPAYAETRKTGIQDELEDFEAGKGIGVKMNVASVTQAGVLEDGRLDLRVIMKITPKGINPDRYLRYYMIKESDGSWKISSQGNDPDKTPPRAPVDIKLVAVSSTRVDITWTDYTSRETGYRIDRGLDSSYQIEPVSVTLPANSSSYSDTTVKPGIKYWYRVVAFNNGGDSSGANWPVTTPASP
jgi:hypothetical protein